LGPLEGVNLHHWTTHVNITTAILILETSLSQREITGNDAIEIMIKLHRPGTNIEGGVKF
jgi:hypothetical protein